MRNAITPLCRTNAAAAAFAPSLRTRPYRRTRRSPHDAGATDGLRAIYRCRRDLTKYTGYDGFGNLTGKIVTKGTGLPGFSTAYDPATNHGGGYDANGNAPMNGECPSTGCYDVENRLRTPIVAPSWGFYIPGSNNPNNFGNYVYDPWGKRVAWRDETVSETGLETKCELYVYGISGQRVASYGCGYQAQDGGGSIFQWTLKGYNVYFAGHMIQSNGVSVTTDRLGSVRKNGNSETFKYLPYGEELTSTADGREKFATYLRDSGVSIDYGLDYADQRYYDRGSGRFLTVDPGGLNAATPSNPASWNPYAYVQGDPINFADEHGLNRDAATDGDGDPGCYWDEDKEDWVCTDESGDGEVYDSGVTFSVTGWDVTDDDSSGNSSDNDSWSFLMNGMIAPPVQASSHRAGVTLLPLRGSRSLLPHRSS